MCSETQATSGYLNHEPRSEAEAVADLIERRLPDYRYNNGYILERYGRLIIRALRAYKPEQTGGEA